jgi:hypothetical protein
MDFAVAVRRRPMPATSAQIEMRERFVGLYFDGDASVRGTLKKAASLAGWSQRKRLGDNQSRALRNLQVLLSLTWNRLRYSSAALPGNGLR